MVDHLELCDSLRRAAAAIISAAKDNDIYPELPTEKYEVFWLGPTDDATARGRHEQRKQPSYEILAQHIGDRIEEHSDVQRLIAACEAFKPIFRYPR